jgi:hypothetical protein
MAPLLSIEGVSKEYHVRGKNVLVLDSVDLTKTPPEKTRTMARPGGL